MPSVSQRPAEPNVPSKEGQAVEALAQLVEDQAHLPTTIQVDGRSNFALLSESLWQQLFYDNSEPSTSTTSSTNAARCIAITFPAKSSPAEPARKSSQALLYTAHRLRTDAASSSEAQPDLFLSSLGSSRSSGGGPATTRVQISAHNPIPLSSVLLTTSSEELLAAADPTSSSAEAFSQGIHRSLARQGGCLRLPLGFARVIQTEPVVQGIILPSTDILVAFDAEVEADLADADGDLYGLEGDDLDAADIGSDAASNAAEVAIGERFLAGTVLDDFVEGLEDDQSQGLEEATSSIPNGHPPSSHVAQNGSSFSANTRSHVDVHAIVNRNALVQAIDDWKMRQRAQASYVDQESAMLLDEATLAQVGAFDGDWAVVELVSHDKPRLVRLFTTSSGSSRTSRQAWAPPTLLQNLHSHSSRFDPFPRRALRLAIVPVRSEEIQASGKPAYPLACSLPIPFADAVTIARVPSALSINRTYQPLFLEALRRYFDGHKRIVRQGDVIAVGVDKGKVRWTAQQKDKNEQDGRRGEGADEGQESSQSQDTELVDYDFPTSHSGKSQGADQTSPTGVVYFVVTSLTPELSEPQEPDPSLSRHHELLTEMTQMGQLGAVVDPSLTKLVQTGVAGSRVSDCEGWLGVESTDPPLPSSRADTALTSSISPFGRICELINATLQPRAARFGLHLSVLLKGARGSGKTTVVRWAARRAGIHLIEINCFDVLGDSDTQTEGVLRARFESAASCGPAILLLRNVDALARKSQAMETGQEPAMSNVLRDCIASLKRSVSSNSSSYEGQHLPVAVFATTSDPDKCPNGVISSFKHEIAIDAPNEAERLEILQTALGPDCLLSPDVSVKDVATQTAALVAADLVDLVARAKVASVERVRKAFSSTTDALSPADLMTAGLALTGADFDSALAAARSNYSESIGAPKIPNVTWDDVGGLKAVKDDILDTIQLPLEHPELFADGLKKRSGILLYGPPGTGKTLLAKAVATSCSLNFFSVKGPELLNMYIGESEANVRRVFQRARDAKPCVIFFDELDSVAPKRGNQGDSGGVMDRIVSQLLAELDGMAGSSEGTDVFVIGATNRPDLLDPALLRPGRFDRMLYLSVSETHDAQLNILQALTRKFRLDEDLGDLSVIAEQCPFNLTGADFYALCSDAMLKAMTRKAGEVDDRIRAINEGQVPLEAGRNHPKPMTPQYYLSELASQDEIQVRVSKQDFELALAELVPSVSEAEMEHYRSVQKQFSGPTKKEEQQQGQGQQPGGGVNGGGGGTIQDLARQLQSGMKELNGYEIGEAIPNSSIDDESKGKGKGKGKGKATEPDATSEGIGNGVYAEAIERPRDFHSSTEHSNNASAPETATPALPKTVMQGVEAGGSRIVSADDDGSSDVQSTASAANGTDETASGQPKNGSSGSGVGASDNGGNGTSSSGKGKGKNKGKGRAK